MPERKRIYKDGQSIRKRKSQVKQNPQRKLDRGSPGELANWQIKVGNRALQRLIAQRSASAPTELDDETTARINHERGGGQPLDTAVQKQTGNALGADFGRVRVHTDSEADLLNHQLNARAFTTGQDIFFREGAYQPGSTGGQELITHELAHVVQQGSGTVNSSGGRMTVNPPGDRFEQEADAAARQAVQPANTAGVQRQAPEEEEEEVQAKALQRQEVPEEELQAKFVQRQAPEEEEELQTKTLQRQELPEEEEEQLAQKQEMEDEEEGKV